MHRNNRRRQIGFTLIEVVVALAVGGVVILGAHALLAAVADGADRITHASVEADRIANGERLLRALLGRLEVGTDSTRRFAGDEREARFTSWCDVPAGWLERCEVHIAVRTDGAGGTLSVLLPTGIAVEVRRGVGPLSLRYLTNAAEGGRWVRTWGASLTAPLALGIVSDRDTMIVRIGERG